MRKAYFEAITFPLVLEFHPRSLLHARRVYLKINPSALYEGVFPKTSCRGGVFLLIPYVPQKLDVAMKGWVENSVIHHNSFPFPSRKKTTPMGRVGKILARWSTFPWCPVPCTK